MIFLQSILDEFGTPDIVLDDGSHRMSHILASFQFLYPRLAKNGIYMVEDLHTSYWEEYEGGLKKPSTFVEVCKNFVDDLNADHSRGALTPNEFTRTTIGMHFYDSVVVFERELTQENGRRKSVSRDMTTQEIFSGVTLHGFPVRIELQWPFHRSEGGSDWYVVHGTIRLADGGLLHADIALNLGQTI